MRIHRALAPALLAAAAALFTRPAPAQEPRNTSVSSAATAAASADDLAFFEKVRTHMNGVEGYYDKPVTTGCAAVAADPFGLNRNWFPFKARNEIACGRFREFGTTKKSRLEVKNEMDWNIYLLLGAPFVHLQKPGHAGRPIEAEVTPDESFFDNPWFPRAGGPSVLQGKNLCVCGPFVRDEHHDDAREIHPSQVIWWEGEPGDDAANKTAFRHFLLAVQDDSARFDDSGDFDCKGFGDNIPAGFQPWAAAPIAATFRIAFLVFPPRSAAEARFFTPARVRVTDLFRRLVVTGRGPARADSDDGTQHVLEYDGRALVVVDEAQAADDDIGVQFVDIRKRADGRVQGYVQLSTSVGNNAAGDKGGYHLISAEVTPSAGLVGPLPGEVHVPTPCEQERKNLSEVRRALAAVREQIRRARAEFAGASPAMRAILLKEIKELREDERALVAQEGAAGAALAACRGGRR